MLITTTQFGGFMFVIVPLRKQACLASCGMAHLLDLVANKLFKILRLEFLYFAYLYVHIFTLSAKILVFNY